MKTSHLRGLKLLGAVGMFGFLGREFLLPLILIIPGGRLLPWGGMINPDDDGPVGLFNSFISLEICPVDFLTCTTFLGFDCFFFS